MRGGYDPERAALIIVDAMALGDKPAAKKWGIHRETIRRYRKRLMDDERLRQLVAERKATVEHDLATLRVAFLREALAEAKAKLKDATLYEVAGAIKVVGELHQTSLVVEGAPVDDPPDPEDPEPAEGRGGGASHSAGWPH